MSKKYLLVGQELQFDDDKPFIQIDNTNLKELVNYLKEFGATYLGNLTTDEIRKAEQGKQIPRIRLYRFKKNENAPKFVKANIAIKLM
jgi:hypothetical protein